METDSLRRLHFWLAITWAAAALPAALFLKNSVLWVVLISHYANMMVHWDGYGAARAEDNNNGNSGDDDG